MSQIGLDDLDQIKTLDASNVYGSVMAFPDQCEHAWQEANKVEVPEDYQQVDKLVMTGMGGSGLAARLVEGLYRKELKIPMVQVHDYDLPGFVDEKTLVVCCSYSGATEEVINNADQAAKRGAKLMVVGTGGKLVDLAKEQEVPYYQIKAEFNPSNQPRMAVGYTLVGQVALVRKTALIKLTHEEVEKTVKVMRGLQTKLKIEVPEADNLAKQLARKMYGKMICFVGSEHLSGAMHTVKNQSNENAKTFSTRFDIPELNHHLMEGLKHPENNKKDLFFWMVQSQLYSDKHQKRIELTQDVIEKNGVETFLYQPTSDSHFSQAFEAIQFGAFVIFYLSMLYGIDPAPIPWVDYFKKRLRE